MEGGPEFYRRIAATKVPRVTREAAERMRRHVRRDLNLRRLAVAWFAASGQPLSPEEWADRTMCGLNTHVGYEGKRRGIVLGHMPSVAWCRADLTPYMAARTIAHESRHAWQFKQEAWAAPTSTGSTNANVFLAARTEWYRKRERDANVYSQKLASVVKKIVGLASRGPLCSERPPSSTVHRTGARVGRSG